MMREERFINIAFIVLVLALSFAGIFYLSHKILQHT